MKIAYILYDGITLLDFIGVYDPLCRLKAMNYLPDLSWDLCGMQAVVEDSFGLKMVCDRVEPDLSDYDLLFIPGGFGTRHFQEDEGFLSWLKTAESIPLKTSVCTGSLLLGAAGFLREKKATTHFDEYDQLKMYCKEQRTDRIVEDTGVITAGAVASALDLGLYLCHKLAGAEAAEEIRKRMDYQPSPG